VSSGSGRVRSLTSIVICLEGFHGQTRQGVEKAQRAGHPLEVGHAFQETVLPELWREFNSNRKKSERLPWLAALVCCSAFDIALHDGYGALHKRPVYETYNAQYMNHDLSHFLVRSGQGRRFLGTYPEEFLSVPESRN